MSIVDNVPGSRRPLITSGATTEVAHLGTDAMTCSRGSRNAGGYEQPLPYTPRDSANILMTKTPKKP